MTKWEYRFASDKLDELNSLGRGGWEAIGVYPMIKTFERDQYGDVETAGCTVLLKRQVQ